MRSHDQNTGSCFCDAVELVAVGQPVAMGYCHCRSCRHWSASPVNAFTLWAPAAIEITQGIEKIGAYSKTSNSLRKWCTNCGAHLFTEHPALGLIDVYAAVIPQLAFEPAVHVNYQESELRVFDGLPKFKDMPAEMGGSGIELPE
jgi:hypothetical protein